MVKGVWEEEALEVAAAVQLEQVARELAVVWRREAFYQAFVPAGDEAGQR